ncbi:MAG: c-di-GMP-binding flagellar brake protein YcgR [Paraglaciecola sp.]|jgi:c-di-GMP-binding flagellar brake protein YcgR
MTFHENKRQFLRTMVNSECNLKIMAADSSRSLRAVCKDISATGMSIDIHEKSVKTGTKVKVHIKSTNSLFPSLTADTKVVHCEEVDVNSCNVGVAIYVLSN